MQIKTGPFLRSPLTIERIMVDVLISLLPAVVAGLVFFRWRAGLIMLLSTAAAVLTEAVMLRVPLTPKGVFGDGSAAVTGLLLGLILPPGTAWWIPVIGSILAIALVKLPFGGLGHNIFNPALGARAILLLAFTSQLVKFTLPFDVVTGATPLLSERVFSWPLVWGNVAGSIGETSVIAILLGAAYLLYKGHINWRIPVGYVGSAFALAVLWGLDPWYTITAGGLLFAAVFMATDMVTSPVTPSGQLLFGIGCGVLTLVIRQYTPFPEGVTFAVLTMNALAPALESLTIPNIFGVGLTQEARYKGAAISMAVLLVVASVFVVVEKMGPTVAPVISGGRHLPIADLLGIDDYEIVDQGEIRYYLRRDEDGNPFKTAFVAEQKGFNGPIRFLLVLDAEQKIESIRILEHSEDPGLGELITKAAFLDQFIALDRDSGFSLGPDIQGVSGATVSSRALTAGVRRALQQFDAVFYPKEEEVAGWADGVYAGRADSFGGPLEVEVTVEDGQITAVAVKKHSDTPGISDRAIEQIPEAIVKANSPQVDAVSGVTVSSGAIMEAVQNALDASGETAGLAEPEQKTATPYEITLPDGMYEGSAAGFGGDVILAVTISGGKITDIAVVQSAETEFIAKPAFDQMLPALVEAQAPVDGVSGATVTSKAILAAVESALSSEAAAATEESAAPYEITLPDGVYEGSAAGRGGDLVLAVTISGGKITDIAVVQSAETEFIAKPAFEQMLPALVEAQAPVDGVSGATITSGAILEAVLSALDSEGGR